MPLEQLISNPIDRAKAHWALHYLQHDAPSPPDLMELAIVARLKESQALKAIAFWKEKGIVREVAKKLYYAGHLN
jgi:hypothetical protein